MQKQENKNQKQAPFKDVSRFTRWVNRMDEKESTLSPKARKSKWVAALIVLLSLFVISFFLFPGTRVKHKPLSGEQVQENTTPQEKENAGTFDMPVDSFENRLKQTLHENHPEKE